MLYDRPYMRHQPEEPVIRRASMVTRLLVVTIGVFVLQQVLDVFFPSFGGRPNTFFGDWFALSMPNFESLKVWTLLSYGFLHSDGWAYFLFIPIPFAHLIFNMLGLYLLGRPVEEILGRRQFLILYLGAILMGGLGFLLANLNGPNVVVGASGGVLGIVTVFCLLHPERQLMLIPIPIPVKARWVLLGVFGFSLFGLSGELAGRPGMVAHSAHLGGMLAGFLYVRLLRRASRAPELASVPAQSAELPAWFKTKRRQAATRMMSYTVNRAPRTAVQAEVDRILDKINAPGFASLSDHEKRTLDEARDLFR
jgi:membrane associated rhomboid family serine protease